MNKDEALETADFLLGQVIVRMQHRVDAIEEKGLESVSISPGFARDIVRACTNGRIAIGRAAIEAPNTDIREALEAAKKALMEDAEPSHINSDDVRVYHLDGGLLSNALEKIRAALAALKSTESECDACNERKLALNTLIERCENLKSMCTPDDEMHGGLDAAIAFARDIEKGW